MLLLVDSVSVTDNSVFGGSEVTIISGMKNPISIPKIVEFIPTIVEATLYSFGNQTEESFAGRFNKKGWPKARKV
jgi:hypothetical protein